MEFKINIVTTLDKEIEDINKKVPYFCHLKKDFEYYDSVSINKNMITISGSRTKNSYNMDILETVNSTFYLSMTKALLYTYFSYGEFEINSIVVDQNNKELIRYNKTDISQVFSAPRLLDINCDKLFEAKTVSDHIANALMNLTMGFNNKDLLFDYTWKCFNVLIRSIFGKKTDFEMLKALRVDIESNSSVYTNILSFMDTCTDDYISKCRINSMICNNYPKGSTKGLIDFLKSFDDSRVIRILQEKIKCKTQDLKSINKLDEILSYYSIKLATPCKKDSDLVRFIILKYCYFLRCKYFHGEKMPSNFIIKNMNFGELERMTEPLLLICKDLIEYRV